MISLFPLYYVMGTRVFLIFFKNTQTNMKAALIFFKYKNKELKKRERIGMRSKIYTESTGFNVRTLLFWFANY